MRISQDDTDQEIYQGACFATGMRCMKLASEGGEINRERLAIELMRLLGGLIEQREECPSSLIFVIEQLRGEPDVEAG